MANPSTPVPRRAAAESYALANSELSAASLSRIQARTKFPSLAAHSARHSQSPPTRRRGRHNVAVSPAEPQFLAPFLGRQMLAAHDELAECPEMAAVWEFVDVLRSVERRAARPQDVNLRNGVALLDVLHLVVCMEPGAPIVPEAKRDLDEAGEAARWNVGAACAVLRAYPWMGSTKIVRWELLDPWALGGFVMLAAVTCSHSLRYLDIIESFDDGTQGLIDGLVRRAMIALGIPLEERVAQPDTASDEEVIDSRGQPHQAKGEPEGDRTTSTVTERTAMTGSTVEMDGRPASASTESSLGDLRAGGLTDAPSPGLARSASVRSPSMRSQSVRSPSMRSQAALSPSSHTPPEQSRTVSPISPPSPSLSCCRRSTRSWAEEVESLSRRLAASEARAAAAERRVATRAKDKDGKAELVALRRRCLDAERRCALLERRLAASGNSGGGSGGGGTPARGLWRG